MRKTLTLTILLVQIIISSSFGKKHLDYLIYYKLINKAELNITEGEYKKACDIYNNAFKKWNNAPTIDYYNALLCEVKLGKFSKAFSYLEILVSRGWEMDYFSRNPFLTKLRENSRWEIFVNDYSKLNKHYKESLDSAFIKKVNEMLNKDQVLAKEKNRYSDYVKTVIINANRINQIIKENKTANWNSTSVYSVMYSPFPSVLLRHYCGIYNEVQKGLNDVSSIINDTIRLINLENSLLLELEKGHLSPLVYDFVTTYSGDLNKYGNGMFFKVGEVVLKKNFSQNEIEQINARRDSIGLSSMDDYIKKMKFINEMKDDKLKPFYFKFRISDIVYQMKGDENKLQEFINNRIQDGWEILSN